MVIKGFRGWDMIKSRVFGIFNLKNKDNKNSIN